MNLHLNGLSTLEMLGITIVSHNLAYVKFYVQSVLTGSMAV